MEASEALKEIYALCQRYRTPAVNVGAHALASKVISIVEKVDELREGDLTEEFNQKVRVAQREGQA